MNRLEGLRRRTHEMVDALFDDLAGGVFARDGAYPTLCLTVENNGGVRLDLVVDIEPTKSDQ